MSEDNSNKKNDHTLRRSSRKTKKISRDSNQFGRGSNFSGKVGFSGSALPSNLESTCRKMMQTDCQANTYLLLSQMESAFKQQCKKLEERFQIKLQIGENIQLPSKIKLYQQTQEIKGLRKIQQRQVDEDKAWSVLGGDISMQLWSGPQEIEQKPTLRKHQSARLLCDNYQKQELIYSVETLIPRLCRQDIDHHFSQLT